MIFQDHVWYAEASMLIDSPYASLGGVSSTTFDPASGQALFPDLNITGFGTYYIQFRVYSDPIDYNMTYNHKLYIVNPDHIGMVVEETYELKVIIRIVLELFKSNTRCKHSNLSQK